MYIERIRAYLTREVALRFLASLALALILWALVTLREDPETSRAFADVPVESVALDDSLVLLDEIDPVRVELSGPESDINPIDANTVVATIDFSGVNEPERISFRSNSIRRTAFGGLDLQPRQPCR
ncbi:MAG: CdaR family protein [Thermomicrobiales bacterium]